MQYGMLSVIDLSKSSIHPLHFPVKAVLAINIIVGRGIITMIIIAVFHHLPPAQKVLSDILIYHLSSLRVVRFSISLNEFCQNIILKYISRMAEPVLTSFPVHVLYPILPAHVTLACA